MKKTIFPEEFGRNNMSKWISRKLATAFFSALFIILNEGLELGVPEEVYGYIVGIVMIYIIGQSAVDIKNGS